MQPDINSPGQFDVWQNPIRKEPEPKPNSSSEQALSVVGEQPVDIDGAAQVNRTDSVQTTVNQPTVSTQHTTRSSENITVREQFEKQLAQLPAEDNDVIEKVWVDKVDEIIEKTKDDPFLEDEAQHSLSRAYLKKRFNLDVD
jgi:hypothetical protein